MIRTGIVSAPPDLSQYLEEILRTWGLPLYETVPPDSISSLQVDATPVLVIPAGVEMSSHIDALTMYVRQGGTVICMAPEDTLATAGGLTRTGEKNPPMYLRITGFPATGLAGETLPIVGRCGIYEPSHDAKILAYLSHPGRYDGEVVGITEQRLGKGRIVVFTFDLLLSVLMLRQGDPARAEVIPAEDGCARPSHLAADAGPGAPGWIPFADLLSRLIVDLIRCLLPCPVPLLSHLPGQAPGILLYSGDEDFAEVAWNKTEFDIVRQAGGRMNLYIIPERTRSTVEDVARYAAHHDIGPHPDLRPFDGEPVQVRVTEFERQVRIFRDLFEINPTSLRNHCTAWAGYMELVEAMCRLDIQMEGNYFSGTYMRDRNNAPYAGFGAAMPMRFCTPDGRLLDVFQQHTHISDDVLFGDADYSYHILPEPFDVMVDRIFHDTVHRFHMPYAVCMHPSNWVKFSGQQGLSLLKRAAAYGIPIWSFDQWNRFCRARDTWRFTGINVEQGSLQIQLEGSDTHDDLGLLLPMRNGQDSGPKIKRNGEDIPVTSVTRYGASFALIPMPGGCYEIELIVST